MKHLKSIALSMLFICITSAHVNATDISHFKGKASPDLKSALCNLKTFDKDLAKATKGKKLTPEQIAEVHQLTYTLEVAVQRVQSELTIIAEDLEKAHKASEVMKGAEVKKASKAYLARTKLLTSKLKCK